MKLSGQPAPLSETFVWQPKIDGMVRDVPMDVVMHRDAFQGSKDQLHVYLGMGAERRVTRRGVQKLGALGFEAVGIVLPFHHLPATAANIERTIVEAPVAIARHYAERAGRSGRRTDLLGHSQGAIAVLMSAASSPESFGAVAAWSPGGLNGDELGDSPEEKRRHFYERLLLKNNLKLSQNPLLDPWNMVTGIEAGIRAIADFRDIDPVLGRRLTAKVDYAMTIDLTEPGPGRLSITQLADQDGIDLRVFGADDDPVFTFGGIEHNLAEIGGSRLLEKVPGSHASPAGRASDQQLRPIADWLHGVRDARQS